MTKGKERKRACFRHISSHPLAFQQWDRDRLQWTLPKAELAAGSRDSERLTVVALLAGGSTACRQVGNWHGCLQWTTTKAGWELRRLFLLTWQPHCDCMHGFYLEHLFWVLVIVVSFSFSLSPCFCIKTILSSFFLLLIFFFYRFFSCTVSLGLSNKFYMGRTFLNQIRS